MKKVVRKNQIIITALALLIAVAGYVSYTQTAASDQAVETAADNYLTKAPQPYTITEPSEDPAGALDEAGGPSVKKEE